MFAGVTEILRASIYYSGQKNFNFVNFSDLLYYSFNNVAVAVMLLFTYYVCVLSYIQFRD